MRVLVIGSGGREHTLAWKIAQSKLVDKIFCAPGNGGISQQAECVDINAEDIPALLDFARREKIDLTVVGPEAPLALGVVDEFRQNGLKVFGPNKKAAQLEASKVFSKELMLKYGVPTAACKIFDSPQAANKYIEETGAPCVVKADGLAQGKGVVVAANIEEAKQAVNSMMQERIFGDAGNKVIIEECLKGQEASILVVTDSRQIVALATAQDHKRAFDNDAGPNTGGMGAYSPAPLVTPDILRDVLNGVAYKMIEGLSKDGIDYSGVLYCGIMLTEKGPRVLEFNVRFGDPETQAILPRLNSDLLEIMLAVCGKKLSRVKDLAWDDGAAVCVVCASGGYPGNYEKGKEVSGLEETAKMANVAVFHAGTKLASSSTLQAPRYLTNGGRVLGVTGLGNSIKNAIARTYQAVEKINFEGMHYRRDIGRKAVGSS